MHPLTEILLTQALITWAALGLYQVIGRSSLLRTARSMLPAFLLELVTCPLCLGTHVGLWGWAALLVERGEDWPVVLGGAILGGPAVGAGCLLLAELTDTLAGAAAYLNLDDEG